MVYIPSYFTFNFILITMANAQVQISFVPNQRGGNSLVYDGYRFQVKTRRQTRVYWTCHVRQCTAKITTVDNIPASIQNQHNHPAEHMQLRRDEVMQQIRKRVREETTPIPSILDDEQRKLRNREWNDDTAEMVKGLPTFDSAKSALYRERNRQRPLLPRAQADVQLDGPWTETTTGEQFLLVDDGVQERILVFATHTGLQHLCRMDTLYGDGTFYICPSIFSQVYTLHGFIDGQMYPLVFCLLPGKSEAIYHRLFSSLRMKCQELGLVLNPSVLFIDFETAVKNAASRVFLGIQVKGCFFHFTQCIWRRVQKYGLAQLYTENEDIHRLIRRASVLPLVPNADVEDVWFNALNDLEDVELPVDVSPFTDYVTEQWIEGDRQQWNHFETVGPRTTNHLEGWHSKVKRAVQHAHPNIFTVIELFQKVEASSAIKMLQFAAGGARPIKRRRYRALNSRLAALKTSLGNGEMEVVHYADTASYLLHIGD